MNISLSRWVSIGFVAATAALSSRAAVEGWLGWRGPEQNGMSKETGLPDTVDAANPLFKVEFPGQSTPVIANGKLFVMGYIDEGPDLREGVGCFDAETGKKLWEQRFNDFISDTIYLRYATSSPGIDPETGNVYTLGTQGLLGGFTPDGKPLWIHSMMERYGRLTFPNARTASPVIDGDLVITRGITANWGAHGAAGDRFYAFDKKSGDLVWSSSPGERPMDNSFALPQLTWLKGKRVIISSSGDGSVVCLNARTGDPLWRVPLAKAGINATALVHNNDKVIIIYGTPYEPGQMVAMKIPDVTPQGPPGVPVTVQRSQVELWANDLSTSTSSPILVGDRIYVVSEKGSLCSVDVNNGNILWRHAIGIEQRNSSPLFADGKLYVPILDDPGHKESGGETGTTGGFYVFKPSDQGPKELAHIALEGRCFGTPAAYNGKVYLQTTKYLYAWGKKGNNPGVPKTKAEEWPKPGPAAQLQIIPSEVVMHPGEKRNFRIRTLDANGFKVEEVVDAKAVKWASYIPPTARVKSTMKGSFDANGNLVADKDPVASAGAFEATLGNLKGYIRGRVLPGFPITQDFESFELTETTTNTVEQPTKFAYPPLPWIGARFKFDVRADKDGNKALTKTIDNKFFQRATMFIGEPDMKNYTIQADVMSEGNRRKMSEVGVICQRYAIVLKGNDKKLEISSNFERLREVVDFNWSPNEWYTLKARVDTNPDGTGVVRAKAWKRSDPEPEKWTIEMPHKTAHKNGCPGLFGFSPQDMRVFIDNVKVTANN